MRKNKDKYIMVRVTAKEKKQAEKNARDNGWDNLSDYIRHIVCRTKKVKGD